MSRSVYKMTRHGFIYLDMSRQHLDMSKQCPDIPPWSQWCCQWHHSIHWVTVIKIRWNRLFQSTDSISTITSCNANYIINGTICITKWRQLKQGVMWFFWSCDAVGSCVIIDYTDGIVNGNILFVTPRWLKQGAMWILCSCEGNTGIIWHWLHHP